MSLVEFKDKEGGVSMVELGSFEVPRSHDDPSPSFFRLVYARLPAREQTERPPLLFLAGGPGDSPLSWLTHPPFRRAFEELAENQDVILLDQRGCGRSEPNWVLPPIDAEGILVDRTAALEALSRQVLALRESTEFEPSWLTPWESARDLPLLAAHLGVPKLDLLAVSYGTHLGMALMKAAPELIRRAIFCGFEGPDQTWKHPLAFERQLDHLEAELSVEALAERVRDMFAKADSHPHTLADGVQVGGFGLRWMLSSWLGLSIRFSKLPGLVSSLESGDLSVLDRLVRGFLKSLERPAAFYLNDLSSSASSQRLDRLQAESKESWMGDVNFPFPDVRSAWNQPPLPAWFRADPKWEGPLLVLTGSLDCFTPTSNVSEAGSGFSGLTHLELGAVAHDQFLGNPAAMGWIKKHLSGV